MWVDTVVTKALAYLSVVPQGPFVTCILLRRQQAEQLLNNCRVSELSAFTCIRLRNLCVLNLGFINSRLIGKHWGNFFLGNYFIFFFLDRYILLLKRKKCKLHYLYGLYENVWAVWFTFIIYWLDIILLVILVHVLLNLAKIKSYLIRFVNVYLFWYLPTAILWNVNVHVYILIELWEIDVHQMLLSNNSKPFVYQ